MLKLVPGAWAGFYRIIFPTIGQSMFTAPFRGKQLL